MFLTYYFANIRLLPCSMFFLTCYYADFRLLLCSCQGALSIFNSVLLLCGCYEVAMQLLRHSECFNMLMLW